MDVDCFLGGCETTHFLLRRISFANDISSLRLLTSLQFVPSSASDFPVLPLFREILLYAFERINIEYPALG